MPRVLQHVWAVVLLGLTACAQVPVEDFADYSRAFAEVRASGDLLLDDVSEAFAFAARHNAPAALPEPGPLPGRFDPAAFLVGDAGAAADPPEVAARRAALATVTAYNDALLMLAEGRSAADAAASVGRLGDQASRLSAMIGVGTNPLVGIAVGGLQEAVRIAESLRAQEAFKTALLAGSDDVHGILKALIADTPAMYDVVKQRLVFDLNERQAALNGPLNTMRTLAGAAAAPTGEFATGHTRIEAELSQAVSGILPAVRVELPASLDVNAPAYGQEVAAGLQVQLTRIRDIADEHEAVIVRAKAYHEVLGSYVVMIDRTGRALTAIEAVVASPPDPFDMARKLIRVGVDLKEKALSLRRDVLDLRAAR